MGVLRNPKHEIFAQELAKGVATSEAYAYAGFLPNPKSAVKLKNHPAVVDRYVELLEKRYAVDSETTEQALAKNQVTKDRIVKELAVIGFTRIDKFLRVTAAGDVETNFDKLDENDEAWGAVKEVVIEEYTTGEGDNAREVKKTRVTLHDKKGALIDLSRMHGMIAPPSQNNTTNIQINLTEKQMGL